MTENSRSAAIEAPHPFFSVSGSSGVDVISGAGVASGSVTSSETAGSDTSGVSVVVSVEGVVV